MERETNGIGNFFDRFFVHFYPPPSACTWLRARVQISINPVHLYAEYMPWSSVYKKSIGFPMVLFPRYIRWAMHLYRSNWKKERLLLFFFFLFFFTFCAAPHNTLRCDMPPVVREMKCGFPTLFLIFYTIQRKKRKGKSGSRSHIISTSVIPEPWYVWPFHDAHTVQCIWGKKCYIYIYISPLFMTL